MIGHICFLITARFYAGLATYPALPSRPGTDSGMAYGIGLILPGLGFALSSLVLMVFINAKGGFGWVIHSVSSRTTLVFSGWLLVVLTTLFCAVFKRKWANWNTTYPQFLCGLAAAYGPLLWLVTCFFSFCPDWQFTVPAGVSSVPFRVLLSISALFSGRLLIGYVRESARAANAEMARLAEQETERHRQDLDFIVTQKPGDPISNLLRYSTHYHPDDVRQAALARTKAHPNWETEILTLQPAQNAYQEVYSFLTNNAVERPKLFVESLRQSIQWLSETTENGVKHTYLNPWSYGSYGMGQLLIAIDNPFPNRAADFYPSVLKLQKALNFPSPVHAKGVLFTVTSEVNAWLAKHKK